jgi:PAS domain S-box-containing protein
MVEPIRVLYVTNGVGGDGHTPALLDGGTPEVDVEQSTDRSDVLGRLDGDEFDCVVTETASAELLGPVRERHPDLPVVLVHDDGTLDALLSPGAVDDSLVGRIRTAVEGLPGETDAREQFRLLSETFPDIAFYIDEEGQYVDVISGTDTPVVPDEPEHLVGESVDGRLSPDAAEQVLRTIEQALASGDVQTTQYRAEVGGTSRWLEGRVSPAGQAANGTRQVLWVARDITDQKERETALEALHGMATAIQTAETVEEACELTVTAAGEILDFEICRVSVQEGERLVPYAVSENAPAAGRRETGIDQGLAGQTFQTGETYVVDQVSPDDETDPAFDGIESGLSVPVGDHGVFQAVSTDPGAFDEADITLAELLVSHTTTAIGRIERERTLTRKTERLEEFASFVSHDLRNPLNVASLRLELLASECDSKHLDELESALDRMERLIDELLTLARQGDTIGETEPVRLVQVVQQAWSNVETGTATLDCPTEMTLRADRNRLVAVLENLVSNAVEHGSSGVTVTVDVLDDEDGFYVADDGAGIPASERDQVFESGYSTDPDGTGFGLTIARDIAEAHGWTIRVTESESGGTRFEITDVEIPA